MGPASAAPDPTSTQQRALENGRPYPGQHEFAVRIKELRCVNEDAYHALVRGPQNNGQNTVRLAHYRRFWEAMSQAASYWDTSCDEYFPDRSAEKLVEESTKRENGLSVDEKASLGRDEPRKRAKSDHESSVESKDFRLPLGSPPPLPSTVRVALNVPPPPNVPGQPAKPPGTYRGYRIGNGATMPDPYRIDAVRAFIEPIAWAFGFTLAGHRRPPVLEIKTLLVPIKLSGTVWRPPNQRERARAGYLQGPVLGISCRSDTEFAEGKSDHVLDALRETGALLCLAQERAREGRLERKPGEGKWWTTVQRWGGGAGGEMGEAFVGGEEKEDEIANISEEKLTQDLEARGRSSGRSSGAKRKLAMANAWKTLRPSVGYWDPRTEYWAIGKADGSDWDEVYLLSSLNHHISILRLRVHKHYLDYLRTGEWPTHAAEPAWSTPVISRSKWYNLFASDDRHEAFRVVWGVMGYLAR